MDDFWRASLELAGAFTLSMIALYYRSEARFERWMRDIMQTRFDALRRRVGH